MKKRVYRAFCLMTLGVLLFAGGCAFTVRTIIAAVQISPETTSMLSVDGSIEIIEFDEAAVGWKGLMPDDMTGIVIPSGTHTLVGRFRDTPAGRFPLVYDFKPKGFYRIYIDSHKVELAVHDWTNNSSWSGEKAQMENLIAKLTNRPTQTTAAPIPPRSTQNNGDIQGAMNRGAQILTKTMAKENTIAIVNVSSTDKDMAQFIADELEYLLVNGGFTVVDRGSLDRIRQEQDFQLSGEVDDNSAVAIGKFAGARVVIVGAVSGTGNMRRLRLRALDTQNAIVLSSASEMF